MNTRLVTSEDINSIVEIHLEAFPNFFLTSLGRSFLRTYYSSSLRSKNCIAVCLIDDKNEITGFAFGTKQSKGFHKNIIKENLIKFILEISKIILTKPKAFIRLYKNLEKPKTVNDDNGDYAELLSIGISSKYKGKGLGKLIIDHFENEVLNKGCKKLSLTTDFYNNDDVINFYKSKNYNVYYDFINYPNRRMYKMIKQLN